MCLYVRAWCLNHEYQQWCFFLENHNQFRATQMMVLSEFWAHKMHQFIGNYIWYSIEFDTRKNIYERRYRHVKTPPQGERVFRWNKCWWCKLFSRIVKSIIKLDYFNRFYQIIYLILANCVLCTQKRIILINAGVTHDDISTSIANDIEMSKLLHPMSQWRKRAHRPCVCGLIYSNAKEIFLSCSLVANANTGSR